MIKITIGPQLVVEGLSASDVAFTKETLTLVNPMWHKLKAMGKPVWGVPDKFRFYADNEHSLYIPRGMRQRFETWLTKMGREYQIVDTTVAKKISEPLVSQLKMRLYQEPIVTEAVAAREGLIVMGTGTGKTIVSLEAIYRLGLTATILVPNNLLLSQFQEEARKMFHYEVGIVNGFDKRIKDITVATYQTLTFNPHLLASLVENTSILVVDEAQSAITDIREDILKKFRPRHLYGLSATPMREDGKTKAINFYFGNTVAEYHETVCTPTIETLRSGADISVCEEYHLMVEDMVKNESRNRLIAGMVLQESLAGRKVLVLTKRIEHYQLIRTLLPNDPLFHFIDSSDPNRAAVLHALKTGLGEFSAIFGTVSLLAVGTDIPRLDTLILACDMKGEVLTTQAAGRILRLFEGKPTPKIIDIFDNKHPVFSRQYWARFRVYKAKGWVT